MVRGPGSRRLDILIVERGLASSRAKAQALILAGRVSSGGVRIGKAGALLRLDAALEITPAPHYVGRGGPKLAAALAAFGVDAVERDAMDVGSSTGGFTQALLEAGARRVIALDVGRGQLDWKLRSDPRVVVMDGVNARYLAASTLPFRPSLAVIDVSFISLDQVLPAVAACLEARREIVALVKPQFEVGRGKVGRGGIVREPELHRQVLRRISSFARDRGWGVVGISASPVRGAEGNAEFFLRLAPDEPSLEAADLDRRIDSAIASLAVPPR